MPSFKSFRLSSRVPSTRLRMATRRVPRKVPEIRTHGRSLQDFLPLLPAEELLLQACQKGDVAMAGTKRPSEEDQASPEVQVRAPFLRFLLLGGDAQAPVHERGVSLHGACIEGPLDLGGCEIPGNIDLSHCLFLATFFAQDACVDGLLTLEGSALRQGLIADRMQCTGGVFLRGGFHAAGEVWLLGAHIGGNLDCSGGQFQGEEGDALAADGVVVKGDVFLTHKFKATGEVRLLGAQIGGDLSCSGGQFEGKEGDALAADGVVVKGGVFFTDKFKATGKVRLLGAQIGGDLSCSGGTFDGKDGDALSLGQADVAGAFFLRNMPHETRVDAGHAQVGVLVDEWSAWAPGSTLDGLRYGAFGGSATVQASERLKWLRRQSTDALGESGQGGGFRPQPWKQLQRVLRDMGHAEDARQIGMAFEVQLRKTGGIGSTSPTTSRPIAWAKRMTAKTFHWCFGFLAGYGYRPMRLLLAMAVVWLVCGVSFWSLALPPRSAIGPSDPLVFQNPAYRQECLPESGKAQGLEPTGNWFLCDALPAEYATFSPLAYSLDIILPLVDLGQEKAWGALVPTPKVAWWQELPTFSAAHVARWLVWFETLFGWVASLLLVGIVSGFARRTEE